MKKEKTKILREKYAGSYTGKKTKLKPSQIVKCFTDYFIGRAKRVLKITNKEINSVHIDVHDEYPITGEIVVWLHNKKGVIGSASFHKDGRFVDKTDHRNAK